MEKVPDHRTWLESVFVVVKYLVLNGLPLRGHIENTKFSSDCFGDGIYLNTYSDLLFPLNPDLKNIADKLPLNAKYTSPQIQNEVIEVLHNDRPGGQPDEMSSLECHVNPCLFF